MRESNSTLQLNIALPAFFDLGLIMRSEQSPALKAFWQPGPGQLFTRTLLVSSSAYKVSILQEGRKLIVAVAPEEGHTLSEADLVILSDRLAYQFDLATDYKEIESALGTYPSIQSLFLHFPGLRTMRNLDFFEGVIASILSQNTSIGHLNKMLLSFSERFGRRVTFVDGSEERLFPVPSDLVDLEALDLAQCGFGYRAVYIFEFCKHYNRVSNLLKDENGRGSFHDWLSELSDLRGVGPKVEAMILSFALAQSNVFVVDVWVRRGLKLLLGWNGSIRELRAQAEAAFGQHSTHVNTYIYYALRNGLLDPHEIGEG